MSVALQAYPTMIDTEAEKAVCASILFDPRVVDPLRDKLTRIDFANQKLGLIFEAAGILMGKGMTPDLVTLADQLRQMGVMPTTVDEVDLGNLMSSDIPVGDPNTYATIVLRLSLERQIAQFTRTKAWDRLSEAASRLDELNHPSAVISLFRFSANSDEESGADIVAPFPISVFPPAPRHLVSIGAEAIGAPPDMIGTPLLVYAAAAIGNRVSIELKRGFTQRAQLYGAVVARPGSAKSPAQDLARAPLDALQRDAHNRHLHALERHDDQLSIWQTSDPKDRGPKPDRPQMEHFFTTDATLEALAPMAERSPGIAMSRDELVSWVKSCDAYRGGKGGDRQMWLSLWAGSPLKIDRKGTDTVYVPEPSISVVGGVQPDMLGELADEAGRQDGLIDRIIWSYPEPLASGWTDEVVEQHHIDAVTDIFRKLRRAPTGIVKLTPVAKADWVAWFNENSILTQQASGLAQGVCAKLPNIAARLALILHCLEHPDNPADVDITTATINSAIELAEYYRSHAYRVLPHFGASSSGHGAGVTQRVARVLEQANGDWVRRTEISKGLGRNVTSERIAGALQELATRCHAESRTLSSGERGGRPTEEWRSLISEITKKRTNSRLAISDKEDDDVAAF